MKSLVQEYLENMREAFAYLSNDSGSSFFTQYSSIPLLVLVFLVATTSSVITCIVSTVFSVTTLLLVGRKSYKSHGTPNTSYGVLLRTIVVISVMVFVVSAPAVIVYGVGSVYMFIIRTLSSSITFILMLRIIGWWNIIRGLEIIKAPKTVIEMIYQTVKSIPLFLSETLRLLAARESRVLGKASTHSIWGSLSSIVAELIVKAYYKSIMLNMALDARTLSENKYIVHGTGNPTIYDICLIMVTVALLVYEVVYRVWSGPL